MGGTVGVGNVVAVATAIAVGGPGTVFWMWVAAFFGMITKYGEIVLGIFYRKRTEGGEWLGGAMVYLKEGFAGKKGLKTLGAILGALFAVFCVLASFGIGNMSQINTIAANFEQTFRTPVLATGLTLLALMAIMALGGLKRIASVTEKMVPFMSIFYIIGGLFILATKITILDDVFISIFKFREALVNKIPRNLKLGITAGIGLFITIIALINAGVVVNNDSTLVGLGDLGLPQVVLAIAGLLIIGVLHHYKVKGDILIGILATWVLGIIAELAGWYVVDVEAGVYSLIPSLSWETIKANFVAPTLFQFDFAFILKNFSSFAIVMFTFLYTDIFDTVGTLIGVAQKGDLLAEDGSLPRAGGALMADAVGTVAGACLGTSTVTSYVESSAGVAAGGRTGLTALTTGILFLIAIPFAPVFLAIPSFATTPAMLFVGLLMLSAVTKMDFDGDVADAIGGFLAVVMMPFAYSIATGIMFAMVSWVVLKLLTGKGKDISPIMWISVVLFAIYIYTTIA